MKIAYSTASLSALLGLLFIGCGEGSSSKSEADAQPRMQFGLYLVGSDLESRGDFGTGDLSEMIEGYEALSLDERSSLDILVAFGGAAKEGWEGVRFASMSCLIEDAANGAFGDATCYEHSDLEANMGDPQTFEYFIQTLNTKGTFERRMLTLWNHGAAWQGIGFDENFGNDPLSLNELQEVLSHAPMHFDIIGMDACLMANYAVAKTVAPYGSYLVASEELEPGHGWNYTDAIRTMGRQSDKAPLAIAKSLVDSFIDTPAHAQTSGKTLSVVDLSKLPTLSERFDALSSAYDYQTEEFFKPAAYSFLQAKAFGANGMGFVSGDLHTYLTQFETLLPQSQTEVAQINAALSSAVVYNRFQNGMEGSHGLSILNPFDQLDTLEAYLQIQTLSDPWKAMLSDLQNVQQTDKSAPLIENFDHECIDEEIAGTCMDITDNSAIKFIGFNLYVPSGNDLYLQIAQVTFAQNMEDARYFFPHNLIDEIPILNTPQGQSYIPLIYRGETELAEGIGEIYTLPITLNGNEALLSIVLNEQNELVGAEASPIVDGTPSNSVTIELSDMIGYEIPIYTLDGSQTGETIAVGPYSAQEMLESFTFIPYSGVKANIQLLDIAHNYAYSPIF